MNIIVEWNLKRMFREEHGGMGYLVGIESVGGNSGHWFGISCGVTNFVYDGDGLIRYFENWQFLPDELRGKYPEGYFRFIIGRNKEESGIIGMGVNNRLSEFARKNFEESMRRYNDIVGFKPQLIDSNFRLNITNDYS